MTGEALQKRRSQTQRLYGLTGMRERVYALEGTLGIKGVQGKGTTVTVSIPLREDKKKNSTTIKRRQEKTAEEM